MMNRLLAVAMLLMVSLSTANSQSVLSSKEMVMIAPILGSEIQLPEQGKKILSQKLTQMVTQNGFGATTGGGVVLTANVVVMDAQATATVPVMFAIEAEVSLVLLNLSEKVVLDEMAITIKGIDSNKDRALVKAISSLSPRSSDVRRFMTNCRTKVLDYYTTRIPALIANANSLIERRQYDEAMSILGTIPTTVDEYPAIADMLVDIYVKRLDIEATTIINKAQVMESRSDFNNAVDELLKVDQSSTLYPTALKRIESIQNRLDADRKAKLEEELAEKRRAQEAQLALEKEKHAAELANNVVIEKMKLDAALEAANKNLSSVSNVVAGINEWLRGLFN